MFVDLAPRFQLMAEDILQRQIQLVINNLKEVSIVTCKSVAVMLPGRIFSFIETISFIHYSLIL